MTDLCDPCLQMSTVKSREQSRIAFGKGLSLNRPLPKQIMTKSIDGYTEPTIWNIMLTYRQPPKIRRA